MSRLAGEEPRKSISLGCADQSIGHDRFIGSISYLLELGQLVLAERAEEAAACPADLVLAGRLLRLCAFVE